MKAHTHPSIFTPAGARTSTATSIDPAWFSSTLAVAAIALPALTLAAGQPPSREGRWSDSCAELEDSGLSAWM